MAKQNRAMLIGAIGAGKSSLTNKLLGRLVPAVKTQTLIYRDWIVDTPGEYTENPMFYKNIMATALEVTHVLYLQDATKEKNIFPPGFSTGINKIPIGVITKSDSETADIERAKKKLKSVIPKGVIVITSAVTGQGIDEIRKLVLCKTLDEVKSTAKEMDPNTIIFL